MNFDLTSEQKQIQDLAKSFAQKEIVPRVREYDRAGKFPLDLVKKMGELGFLGCHVPVEYGGSGLDYISLALMAEEFGAACSSVQTFISVQLSLVTSAIVQWGTEEQKKKYVPKLESGELSLDESLALFERGQVLAKQCGVLLDAAELKVKQLTPDGELEDFTEEE